MPRKTKEQKELEEIKEVKKKKEPKTKASTTKKSDTTKKKATTKATSKKTTTKKTATKKTTAKKSTTKKATTKKTTAKKASTVKKVSATKKPTKKATKKTNTKKEDALLDKTLEIAEYYDLPYSYNKTVVKILAQTPSTLFVYWEISDDDIKNYKKQYGENFFETTKPVLIVHNKTLNYSFEIDINDFANSWYLKINNTKCEYEIELGRRPLENSTIDSNYIYIATSNEIESPNDHILGNLSQLIKFRNVKTNAEFTKLLSSLKISKSMNKLFDIYKTIYQDENIETLTNPSSGSFSSTFK